MALTIHFTAVWASQSFSLAPSYRVVLQSKRQHNKARPLHNPISICHPRPFDLAFNAGSRSNDVAKQPFLNNFQIEGPFQHPKNNAQVSRHNPNHSSISTNY